MHKSSPPNINSHAGVVYITDGNRVRKMTLGTHAVTDLAGSSATVDTDGPFATAAFGNIKVCTGCDGLLAEHSRPGNQGIFEGL